LAELAELLPRSERVHGPKSLWANAIRADQKAFQASLGQP
jgi:hypothetical protein